MNIKARLEKLESVAVVKMPILKILLVGFEPDNMEPIGCSCNGMEAFRQANESTDALIGRLGNLLECPDKPTLYSVSTIYSEVIA